MRTISPTIALALIATAAIAHTGVKDPVVKARMDVMSEIAADMKSLTRMSRGEVPFDAEAAAARMEAIAKRAAAVPELFEEPANDPKSEAAPSIWTSYPEFTNRATALEEAALAGTEIADEFELQEALTAVAQSCKSCHGTFKL